MKAIDRNSALVLAVLSIAPALSLADKANEKQSKKLIIDHWMKVTLDHAKTYSISPANDPATKFKMLDHAVFQHTQVVRPPADDIGAIFLWTDNDTRPAVIGTVFCWSTSNTRRMLCNEFYSLADVPIETKQGRGHLWKSRIPGTKWKPIPNAAKPSNSPRLRRIQAKQLAKQFKAYMLDGDMKRWELRGVPSPIYEYDVKSDLGRGGALFVFCRATDVEVVLLLEVRAHEGIPRWEFTCGQFTDNDPHMTFGGREVWEPFEDAHSKDGNPHFLRMIGNRPKPSIEVDLGNTRN